MAKIFLLGDTHGYAGKELLHHAVEADEIWHTGDWLNLDLFWKFQELGKPIRSCWGNVDGKEIRDIFPLHNQFVLLGISVWLTHIGGYPGKYNPKIENELLNSNTDLFICGHSHIAKAMRDNKKKKLLHLNPGAAGIQGFHRVRTAMKFEIISEKIVNLSIIEFGMRNNLSSSLF